MAPLLERPLRRAGSRVATIDLLPLVLLGAAVGLPVLPGLLRTIYGIVLLVTPGVVLLERIEIDTTTAEYWSYAIGLGVVLTMLAVMATSGVLSLVGIGDHFDTPTLYLGPSVLIGALYLECYRIGRTPILPTSRLSDASSIRPRTLLEYGAISSLPIAAASGAVAANVSGSFAGTIAFYLSALGLVAYLTIREDVSETTFAVAVYALALGFLFSMSVRTGFVVGADVHDEVRSVTTSLNQGTWMIQDTVLVTSQVTSITILGPYLVDITGLDVVAVFKYAYPTILALVPVTSFLVFKRLVSPRQSFLLTSIAISYVTYWSGFHSNNRMGIAVLCSMLFLLAILSSETHGGLAILFITGAVISHYTIAFTFLLFYVGFVSVVWVYHKLDGVDHPEDRRFVVGGVLALLLTFVYYNYVENRFFGMVEVGIIDVILTIQDFLPGFGDSLPSASGGGGGLFGSGSLPGRLVQLSVYAELALLAIGCLTVVWILLVRLERFPTPDLHAPGADGWLRHVVLRRHSSLSTTTSIWIAAIVALGVVVVFFLIPARLAPTRVQGQFQFLYTVLLVPGLALLVALLTAGLKLVGRRLSTLTAGDRQSVVTVLLLVFVIAVVPLQVGLAHVVTADSIQVNLAGSEEPHYVTDEDIRMVRWYAEYSGPAPRVTADNTGNQLLISATNLPIREALDAPDRRQYQGVYNLSRTHNIVSGDATLDSQASASNRIFDAGRSEIRYLVREPGSLRTDN